MFKRHALEVKVVKTPKTTMSDVLPEVSKLDLERTEELAENLILKTAVTIGAVVISVKVVDTFCDIAKLIVKANLR